ncbi:hypothetical protein J5N97_011114 [Dioscorea zingiberensis]|uniref:Protein NAP1 n=1 Tax=Dioscorea zingiberensis TaxID=325984 RepID=A0A9D5D1H9_9LILI|nr:hypothetical protein J5N97_011114 [Dioscorea zingiberensis]
MAKLRQPLSNPDTSPRSLKSKDWDNMSRWSEYLHGESSPATSGSWKHAGSELNQVLGICRKVCKWSGVVQLSKVAEGLMAKMYRLNHILDKPDLPSNSYADSFWQAGVFPNFPKICIFVSKKFPEHPNKLQLDRVDKFSLDAMHENAEGYLQNLEPWVMLLVDLMAFREQALRLILDLSSTVITLLPHQNSLILHAFMDLFCSFVRVNLFSDKKNDDSSIHFILHAMSRGRDCDFYHRLVQFVDSYDPPVKGLQEDLNFVSPRIGEVLEAVGPTIFLSTDTKKLRNEGFLSPFHPRYPDILTNSAHPLRAQDLANVTSYREWVLVGYLVCPDELLRVTSIDIAMVVLKENLILTLFRDEYVSVHEEYQLYVLPRVLESKKMAKSGRAKQKEADLEYNVAKQVEKMISEVHEQALLSCDAIHHERRILLKQEIGRMVLFFSDQPSLLAPNIQMVFSTLALAQCEIIWYFRHVGVSSSKSKPARVIPIDIDAADPTIGFLLDGIDKLCCLVRKYIAAIKGYALSYLSSCAGRIRFLLGTPGMVALDLDNTLRGLFQQVVHCLETIPKSQGENISAVICDLSDLSVRYWLSILMIVTSSRSAINIRHLEKATVSTGKEGLLSEGNAAYIWSRCVDELESQLSKHGSLMKLYFYHHHLTTVISLPYLGTLCLGLRDLPQHCCAWLGVASSFPDCASTIVPEEITILYVESLIESIMGGLEGLINILDSEGGFGALEMQLSPEQAALRMINAVKVSNLSMKSPKGLSGLSLPGYESYPKNNSSVKMLEAAMQRLTNLCSVLNDMEPICVLNHVFVLREYMRDCILGNFRRRLLTVLKTDNGLQRPSVVESLIRRHISIIHLAEQHISMDLTEGLREVLLMEAFTGLVSNLHNFEKPAGMQTGSAVEFICHWYMENIVKDSSGAGIVFMPMRNCFTSSQPVGGYFAESFTDLLELKSLIHVFGGYGLDRMDRMLRDHMAALLNCIDTALRSNHDHLEVIAGSINTGDRIEREASLKQILDMETLVGFCIQVGQAIAFHQILVEAAKVVLEEKAPLLVSLMHGVAKQLPDEIPEKDEVKRLRRVATSMGVVSDHDMEWVHLIMLEANAAADNSWSLLPYLCASFMISNIWNSTTFNVSTGGFNNNVNCLARCINAVIAASEFVRLERGEYQRQSTSNGHANEVLEPEILSRATVEANAKSAMQLYTKCSAVILLDSWSDSTRSNIVPKLIFMDQLCELSPYLPRSTLEMHIPYAILRSIYRQHYGNSSSMAIEILAPSPRQSPAVSLAHSSPAIRHHRGDSTPQSKAHSIPVISSSHQQEEYDVDVKAKAGDKQHRGMRSSGPLDYGSGRKVKFVEGSTSGGQGPSPLPRFAVSRSGPLLNK